MSKSKVVAALVPSLWAAAALVVTTVLIAEISAAPTATPGVDSSIWTPVTSVTALFFGADSFHGSFDLPSILFGLAVILLASVLAGSLAAAFIAYCLGRHPHPLAASILGAACGLATEILLINLLCNWLQSDNALYNSLPSWGWWIGMGAWGTTLGLAVARSGRRTKAIEPTEGGWVGLAGPSPLLPAEPHPTAPHPTRTAHRSRTAPR